MANSASGSSITSRNSGLWLRHDHAFDHPVMRMDIDGKQAEITFLQHPRDRLAKRKTAQAAETKKCADDGVTSERNFLRRGVKMRILTTAAGSVGGKTKPFQTGSSPGRFAGVPRPSIRRHLGTPPPDCRRTAHR